ncbi:DUF1304 domain-containing protein [Algibacter amylolyticus]|uniref:DUF1304 domain-containing protein n=1 Tax=Algibacter amylolyticus TaxID=1608400 RepID=A0A5M7BKJ1_9FLAO|nr:DUF1304 domain-containing protein [Algibacter amylolyticus]KAA5827811.1 DUF1304 family protein [Algibacter amylolyticus]MBB5267039.1 putative membrane protein [Algibacter amylolyticus]TSJ82056.1 DUF1304 domain-containing protein [Algibacter amylolyticus]
MTLISTILIAFIAVLHFYFLVLEMFMWTTPKTIKAFGLKSKQFAQDTKVLAANQGLYNGILAATLVFSIINQDIKLAIFLLICVTIAGIYGSYSTKQIKLFYVQSVPAIIALIFCFV